jgi:TPR repeat protein
MYYLINFRGHPGALERLGVALLNGELGLETNLELAVKWFKRSMKVATKQYSGGLYQYAVLHEKGLYPVLNEDNAFMLTLLEKACKLGNKDAHHKCAIGYEFGLWGLIQSFEYAYDQYYKAATRGNIESMYRLALFHLPFPDTKNDIEPRSSMAYKWAHKAAKLNHVLSMQLVSGCYKDGYGTQIDLNKSKYWSGLYKQGGKTSNHGEEKWL